LRGLIPFFEIAFGLYFSYIMFDALHREQWMSAVFVLVFQVGFLYVGIMSLIHDSGWFRRATPVLSSANA